MGNGLLTYLSRDCVGLESALRRHWLKILLLQLALISEEHNLT